MKNFIQFWRFLKNLEESWTIMKHHEHYWTTWTILNSHELSWTILINFETGLGSRTIVPDQSLSKHQAFTAGAALPRTSKGAQISTNPTQPGTTPSSVPNRWQHVVLWQLSVRKCQIVFIAQQNNTIMVGSRCAWCQWNCLINIFICIARKRNRMHSSN